MFKATFVLALFMSFALAHAEQDASTKMNIREVTGQPKQDDAIDTIITNNKLRTETGAKARYSISTSMGYAGGSLKQPFGETRPNISGAVGTTDYPSMGGSISAKYNISTQHSLFGGTGMRWLAPLSGATPSGYKGNRLDVDNPYIVYQYIYNWRGLQSALSGRQTFVTTSDSIKRGALTSWGFGQNSVYEIGDSGFSVGVNTWVGFGVFTKHTAELKTQQGDYSWAFIPAIEYRLTDRANLRMDSNLFNFEHIRSTRDPWTFRRLDVSQNFSFGYSVTRDLYVSPGVSFVLGNLRADRTTWSLGAGANIF